MKTRKNQPTTKWFLLLSTLMAITVSVQTFAAERTKQKTDLTELSIEDLMNVEVASTATLTDTKPRLVPAAMTTITAEQIEGSGARSLFELLDIYVPNLQVIRHHWESDHIGLRGIINDRDDKYLLLVNGKNMNERTHFGALSERDLVMLGDIHHIDIVRGPGSAMYGPGAVSMVINIVTYNADTFQGTEITSRTGSIYEFYSGEVKHGQRFDNNDGGIFIYAGMGKTVGANQKNAPFISASDYPNYSFIPWRSWGYNWETGAQEPWGVSPYEYTSFGPTGTKAGEPLTGYPIPRDGEDSRNTPAMKFYTQITKDNWDIWARYTHGGKKFVWDTESLKNDPWGYADWDYLWHWTDQVAATGYPLYYPPNLYDYQQATGYIGYKQELTKDIDIDYAFSYDRFYLARFQNGRVSEYFREDNYYGKALMKWQVNEQHKVALGTEVLHGEFGFPGSGFNVEQDPCDSMLNPMPRWSTTMYSLLGEHQWTINDKWTTFLGGRIDKHTFTNIMFSPRAAVAYTPTEIDTLKLMWSKSVRANNEESMKAQAEASGDKSKPEILDSAEFRFERQQTKNLDLATSLFWHYNLELISYDQATAQTTSVGKQKEWGIELEASYHTDKTRLTISHAYTKLIDFELAPGKDTYVTAKPYGYGNDFANWSNHITKLTAQQMLTDKLTFNGSLRIYWGFQGLKDYNKYVSSQPGHDHSYDPDGAGPIPTISDPYPYLKPGFKKSFRGNYYLDLGFQYKAAEDLTIGVTGYNLLGIFNKDLNKRNYLGVADYRDEAVAVGVSVEYKF